MSSSSAIYSRNTELRNVEAKDLYNLAVILDDNKYWQQLMEIIPKNLNNQTFATASSDLDRDSLESTAYERKYTNDHIRLIESAILYPGESRLFSQILFDEWGSSGRQHERPTLGVLLHLLVQSKLYRAADFVAELLKESKPLRPTGGPAAEYEFEIDVFNDSKFQAVVNDSKYYPNTEDLQENVNNDNKSCMNVNKDYYTKYHEDKDKKLTTVKDITTEVATTAPKPPPRSQKSARLLKQQQQQQLELKQPAISSAPTYDTTNNITHNKNETQNHHQFNTKTADNDDITQSTNTTSSINIPKLSALMNPTNSVNNTMNYYASDSSLPKLSLLENSSDSEYISNSIPFIIGTKPHVANDHNHHTEQQQYVDLNSIPTVIFNKPLKNDVIREVQLHSSDKDDEQHHDLPAISALNINGERDDDDDDDVHSSLQTSKHYEDVPSVALNYNGSNARNHSYDNIDINIPSTVSNVEHDDDDDINQTRHHLEAIAEDYNGIEHEHDNENEHDHDDEDEDFIENDDDDNSLPNLSFLDNRSSNNESSLTSVTNTSGDNSFEQSVNDCSSTSTDNVPILSVFNQ